MNFRPGVLTDEEATGLFHYASEQRFALPAVNVTGMNSINATLETAREVRSPVVIQLSHTGAQFIAGASLSGSGSGLFGDGLKASISGAVSAAFHVHQLAELYGVPVILHTDHADRKRLPWVDGLLEENRNYKDRTGMSLFSSHMLDLSTEPLEQNINTCSSYLEIMKDLGLGLEMELGVTGGIEDGFDHSEVDLPDLYTQPEAVAIAWERLSAVSPHFTIAASFGNAHGVYRPGDIELKPEILRDARDLIQKKFRKVGTSVKFVFHGGSGCSREELRRAISYGTVKVNINTDLQWAFWEGIRDFYEHHRNFMQSQIGNPEGEDRPNKSWYNPQVWLREGEKRMVKRLKKYFEDLNCMGRNRI